MQPREEKTILINERAFAPASIPLVEPNWCSSSLYRRETPEYGETLSKGTVNNLEEEFTLEEKITLDKFNRQFSLLVENIEAQCVQLGIIDLDLLQNIEKFNTQYTSRVFYVDQPNPRFYTQIKQSLEAIAFHLSHNTLLNDVEKKRMMVELIEQIAFCSGGVFQHIENTRNNLSTHETSDAWLANFRLTLIQQAASDHVRKHIFDDGNEIHAKIVLLKYADEQGWAPYGIETRSAVEDIFANLAEITPAALETFRNNFLQRYNPIAIMMELATRLHDSITTRLQKKRSEQQVNDEKEDVVAIQGANGLDELLSGIPFNEKGLMPNDVFDSMRDEETASFCWTSPHTSERSCFSLKSIPQLMLSMTTAFAREKTPIFETYQDEYYTLVKGSPELCHQYSEDTPPVEAAQQSVRWMKENNTYLTHLLFHSLYRRGIRDFSGCTLYQVDFSECSSEELILKNTHVLASPKMTPTEQFNALFEKYYQAQITAFARQRENQAPLLVEAAKINDLEGVKRLLALFVDINTRDPSGFTALHYAAKEGHLEMVQLLLDNHADDTIRAEKDDPKTTPLAYAASHKKWKCVELLIPKKSRTIDGYIVLLAAKDNQYELVMDLLIKKTIIDINIRVDEKTVLWYAVNHALQRKGGEHAVEHKDKQYAVEHKDEEHAVEHKNKQHAVEYTPVQIVRSLLAVGAQDDFSILINAAVQSQEIDLAILLLIQDMKDIKTRDLIGELHKLTQTYAFSPEINKHFLDFYQTLQNDATSDETKATILQHFIDILKSNINILQSNEAEEEKDQCKNQKKLLIIEKILNSEQDLKNKLNRKPSMSLPLKIALGALFGGIAILAVSSIMIYLGIGVAGIEIGNLLLPCLINSLITGAPVSYFSYFRHKEYSEKKARNNGCVDAMLKHFKTPSPS